MFGSSLLAALNLSWPHAGSPACGPAAQTMAEWHAICCLFAADIPKVTEGLTMKRRGLIAFAAAGVIIGGAWLITATAIRAQQQPAPAAPPTQAVPPIRPADPNL